MHRYNMIQDPVAGQHPIGPVDIRLDKVFIIGAARESGIQRGLHQRKTS